MLPEIRCDAKTTIFHHRFEIFRCKLLTCMAVVFFTVPLDTKTAFLAAFLEMGDALNATGAKAAEKATVEAILVQVCV